MILQNVIWRTEPQELYYRGKVGIGKEHAVVVDGDETFQTDTYMNLFDLDFWKTHTELQDFQLKMRIAGDGEILVQCLENEHQRISKRVDREYAGEVTIAIPKEWEGKIFFSLRPQSELKLFSASYVAGTAVSQIVRLAVVVCTFKRESQLRNLVTEILKSKGALRDEVQITIVDNASELPRPEMEGVHLYHNVNTGGSGGFARGMDEVVKNHEKYPASHVLLMDDDVVLEPESIIRLYAVLSYLKKEYQGEIVAGRMFRLDDLKVQYTAAEVWNGGEICHVGHNLDMTEKENLLEVNNSCGAEYGGWWFHCIPYGFVKDNRPLPFFVHCDDVEYGLRHGGTPIILNGIQVWHETYEYRQGLDVAYYDMRNSLIVNAIYGRLKPKEELLTWWMEKITKQHVTQAYQMEWMLIRAMNDFLRGWMWFKHHDAAKYHIKVIKKKRKAKKIYIALAWRIVYVKFNILEKKVARSYTEGRCNFRSV